MTSFIYSQCPCLALQDMTESGRTHLKQQGVLFTLKMCKSKPLVNSLFIPCKALLASTQELCYSSWFSQLSTPLLKYVACNTVCHYRHYFSSSLLCSSMDNSTRVLKKASSGLALLRSYKTLICSLLNRHMGRNRYMSDLNISCST